MKPPKTFGQYLVERGAVTGADLLDVLVAQAKAMPSVFEIVTQAKLVPPEELIGVVALQSARRTDFISACKESGHWSDALEKAVWGELERARVPLVELLVREKGVNQDEIGKLLDSYLSEVGSEPSAPESSVAADEISVAVLELGELFSENVRDKLDLAYMTPEDPSMTAEARQTVHRLAGAARFAKLPRLQAILEEMEAGAGEKLSVAWSIRNHVLRTGSENGL